MSNERDSFIPAKMNIIASNRITLVNFIKYAWKTDYITRHLEVRELPEYKSEIIVSKELLVI